MGNQSTDVDIFRILVATDNHLGYGEKDSERGNDSFTSFEEVLQLAVEKDADFILLGGDLFHENKPSRSTLMKCMQLLRKYTFGDNPVRFDFVSDPSENFPHLKDPAVNYQDPNLNISIPVFSIHGNHDDPAGMGQFCALDMLSTAGLINYFGRATDLKEIKISPVLLTKGQTKLAIYGLSSVKDERLYRLFKDNKVKMLRPKENFDDWFNIFVLHQNHARHSLTNYIPEHFLDKFLHLVIWGHEHECKVNARLSEPGTFFVMQPGSSVVTSLSAGEAIEKNIAILEVNCDKNMRVTPLKLKTVRPFVFKDLSLLHYEMDSTLGNEQVEKIVEENIWKMIEESKEQLTGHPKQPTKPLIRLRVEYTEEWQLFNIYRFGHKFSEDIANSDDAILFKKFHKDAKKGEVGVDFDAMDSVFEHDVGESKVEDLVQHYFADLKDENHQLQLLTERGLAWAVGQFVEKDNKDSVREIFGHQLEKISRYLLTKGDVNENNIDDFTSTYRDERLKRTNNDDDQKALDSLVEKSKSRTSSTVDDYNNDIDLLADDLPKQSVSGNRGRGGRSRGRGNSKTVPIVEIDSDTDSFEDDIKKSAFKGGSRSRGRSSTRASSSSSRTSTRRTTLQLIGEEEDMQTSRRGRGRGSRRAGTTSRAQTSSIANCFQKLSNKKTPVDYNGSHYLSDSE